MLKVDYFLSTSSHLKEFGEMEEDQDFLKEIKDHRELRE